MGLACVGEQTVSFLGSPASLLSLWGHGESHEGSELGR